MARPSDICIRFGRPDERLVLEEMQRRASLQWEEDRDALLAQPDLIELPVTQLEEQRVRVAEIEGIPAGFSVLLPLGDGIFELDGLFVEPSHWRLGVGRALMNDAVRLTRLNNGSAIDVTANPRAKGFYLGFGFVCTGRAQTLLGHADRMRYVVTERSP
jgi:GNAT superfamily N-acetyltransferase